FRTEHAAVEGKLFPWLEPDDLVIPYLELNSALLAAKTAMRRNQLLRRILRFALPAARRFVLQMRTVARSERRFINRRPCHGPPFASAVVLSPVTCACTSGIRPARCDCHPACSRNPICGGRSSNRRYASPTQTAHRSGCSAFLHRNHPPPDTTSRPVVPGVERCGRTFRMADRADRRRQ